MKLRIMSDLHLDFDQPLDLEPAGEDVLLLAGDIAIYTDGIEWADRQAQRLGVPVLMIAGNHEFYRTSSRHSHTLSSTIADLYNAARRTGGAVTFLENDTVPLLGGFFIGATLWTDFCLWHNQPLAMLAAQREMNDYRLIHEGEDSRKALPKDMLFRHMRSRQWLDTQLSLCSGPTVVMTHHAPSPRSIASRYVTSELNPAYASDLAPLIIEHRPDLWVHGHIHANNDYVIDQTRVISNPRGCHRFENEEFNPNLIIEV